MAGFPEDGVFVEPLGTVLHTWLFEPWYSKELRLVLSNKSTDVR
jgi:hypothetical protein